MNLNNETIKNKMQAKISPDTTIRVRAHARLHMGFFDMHGGFGRKFGSLGLALASPTTEIRASFSDKFTIVGNIDNNIVNHIAGLAQAIQKQFGLSKSLNIQVEQLIPSHAGLGSGTQIKLALLAVFDRLNQLNLDHNGFMQASGRGARSGIGLATFLHGGVVVDAGRPVASSEQSVQVNPSVPPMVARTDFPENWPILLVLDSCKQGVHGEQELNAFKKLPEFPADLAATLCRHVLMQALPALHERDLTTFGKAVKALQQATGEHFAKAQGGIYASYDVAAVMDWLEVEDVACFGQSSWGPAGFAIFENESKAQACLAGLNDKFGEKTNLKFLLTKAVNKGALVTAE